MFPPVLPCQGWRIFPCFLILLLPGAYGTLPPSVNAFHEASRSPEDALARVINVASMADRVSTPPGAEGGSGLSSAHAEALEEAEARGAPLEPHVIIVRVDTLVSPPIPSRTSQTQAMKEEAERKAELECGGARPKVGWQKPPKTPPKRRKKKPLRTSSHPNSTLSGHRSSARIGAPCPEDRHGRGGTTLESRGSGGGARPFSSNDTYVWNQHFGPADEVLEIQVIPASQQETSRGQVQGAEGGSGSLRGTAGARTGQDTSQLSARAPERDDTVNSYRPAQGGSKKKNSWKERYSRLRGCAKSPFKGYSNAFPTLDELRQIGTFLFGACFTCCCRRQVIDDRERAPNTPHANQAGRAEFPFIADEQFISNYSEFRRYFQRSSRVAPMPSENGQTNHILGDSVILSSDLSPSRAYDTQWRNLIERMTNFTIGTIDTLGPRQTEVSHLTLNPLGTLQLISSPDFWHRIESEHEWRELVRTVATSPAWEGRLVKDLYMSILDMSSENGMEGDSGFGTKATPPSACIVELDRWIELAWRAISGLQKFLTQGDDLGDRGSKTMKALWLGLTRSVAQKIVELLHECGPLVEERMMTNASGLAGLQSDMCMATWAVSLIAVSYRQSEEEGEMRALTNLLERLMDLQEEIDIRARDDPMSLRILWRKDSAACSERTLPEGEEEEEEQQQPGAPRRRTFDELYEEYYQTAKALTRRQHQSFFRGRGDVSVPPRPLQEISDEAQQVKLLKQEEEALEQLKLLKQEQREHEREAREGGEDQEARKEQPEQGPDELSQETPLRRNLQHQQQLRHELRYKATPVFYSRREGFSSGSQRVPEESKRRAGSRRALADVNPDPANPGEGRNNPGGEALFANFPDFFTSGQGLPDQSHPSMMYLYPRRGGLYIFDSRARFNPDGSTTSSEQSSIWYSPYPRFRTPQDTVLRGGMSPSATAMFEDENLRSRTRSRRPGQLDEDFVREIYTPIQPCRDLNYYWHLHLIPGLYHIGMNKWVLRAYREHGDQLEPMIILFEEDPQSYMVPGDARSPTYMLPTIRIPPDTDVIRGASMPEESDAVVVHTSVMIAGDYVFMPNRGFAEGWMINRDHRDPSPFPEASPTAEEIGKQLWETTQQVYQSIRTSRLYCPSVLYDDQSSIDANPDPPPMAQARENLSYMLPPSYPFQPTSQFFRGHCTSFPRGAREEEEEEAGSPYPTMTPFAPDVFSDAFMLVEPASAGR